MSTYLARNNPTSLQGLALMIGQEWQQEIWKNLDYSLKTGLPALIVEHLIPDNNEPVYGKILDLQMLLIMPGGRERTASQFETLLHSAGFKLTKIIPTKSTFSIIEAEK